MDEKLLKRAKLILVKQAMIKRAFNWNALASTTRALGRGYRPLYSAGAGALAGGLYGAATGQEGDRFGSALRGAAVGGALGGGIGLAAKAVNPITQRLDKYNRQFRRTLANPQAPNMTMGEMSDKLQGLVKDKTLPRAPGWAGWENLHPDVRAESIRTGVRPPGFEHPDLVSRSELRARGWESPQFHNPEFRARMAENAAKAREAALSAQAGAQVPPTQGQV